MLYALAALIVSAAASYYTLRRRRHGLDDGMNNDRAKRYLEGFAKRDASCSARGLCGRFIRGVNAQQLSTLSDEPGKLFSWVCTDELLQGVLGKGPAGALVQVGFGLDWIRARLDDGTTFRLVVFPVGASSSTTQATWDNLFTLVRAGYGDAIANRLAPHMAALRSTPIDAIDTAARLRSVSNLPVSEKMAHPEYMTAEQFLAVPMERVTLYHARAFFYHAVGCNMLFRGDGTNYQGLAEYVTANRPLSDIPGAAWLDLDVTITEIDVLVARKPPSVTGKLDAKR